MKSKNIFLIDLKHGLRLTGLCFKDTRRLNAVWKAEKEKKRYQLLGGKKFDKANTSSINTTSCPVSAFDLIVKMFAKRKKLILILPRNCWWWFYDLLFVTRLSNVTSNINTVSPLGILRHKIKHWDRLFFKTWSSRKQNSITFSWLCGWCCRHPLLKLFFRQIQKMSL